ncbi:hypothetical protein RIF29_16234 [Crotalaria pallida]|uniref:Uncharacterized protein n=1 Tax=Crotalaria pallida TaxID=3830 RepID=A0AAN9FER3_CROPI
MASSLSGSHAKPTSEEQDLMDRTRKKVKVGENDDSMIIMDDVINEVQLEKPEQPVEVPPGKKTYLEMAMQYGHKKALCPEAKVFCGLDVAANMVVEDAAVTAETTKEVVGDGSHELTKAPSLECIPGSVEPVMRIPDISEPNNVATKDMEATNDKGIYGPWMVVQKHPRRKQKVDKSKKEDSGVSLESPKKHVPFNEKGKEELVGKGSRFEVLSQQSEDVVTNNVGPTIVTRSVFKGRGPNNNRLKFGPKVEPKKQVGGSKASKPKMGKPGAIPLSVKGSNDQILIPLVNHASSSSGPENPHNNTSREETEEMKRREKEIFAAMSREQNKMWKQFKDGEYVDDILGCSSVLHLQKEHEFLKQQASRNKEGSESDDLSLVNGMEAAVLQSPDKDRGHGGSSGSC